LRNSALVRFEVTANYLFSKFQLQALIFKIPASAKLAVKYQPSSNPILRLAEKVLVHIVEPSAATGPIHWQANR